jgi:hypothetical protein
MENGALLIAPWTVINPCCSFFDGSDGIVCLMDWFWGSLDRHNHLFENLGGFMGGCD